MKYRDALKIRKIIEKAAASLDDESALEGVTLFPKWTPDTAYDKGIRVKENNILYRCITAHTSQAQWRPSASPSLWTKVLIPDKNTAPQWEQPESTNGYCAGDKVMHNGKIWISDIDNNIWQPGTHGWSEYRNL